MFCSYCGTRLQEEMRFCPACGKPTAAQTMKPAMNRVPQQAVNQSVQQSNQPLRQTDVNIEPQLAPGADIAPQPEEKKHPVMVRHTDGSIGNTTLEDLVEIMIPIVQKHPKESWEGKLDRFRQALFNDFQEMSQKSTQPLDSMELSSRAGQTILMLVSEEQLAGKHAVTVISNGQLSATSIEDIVSKALNIIKNSAPANTWAGREAELDSVCFRVVQEMSQNTAGRWM
ncbi:MAG: zinc ribbon domain-containing protein [Eubacterium sp.]|nr:zinc ribbon domain-containing protein [Eubacterium sp.]